MDRRTFLSAGTVALGSPLSRVWADKDAANAAEHYRKAFSLVPEANAFRSPELHEAENQLLNGLPAAPFHPTGLDLLKRNESALREMARGAELKECEWGNASFLDDETFPILQLSQLGKLSCLRASYSFQKGDSHAAIGDVEAVVKTARHIGSRGAFMPTVVQIAMENSAIDVTAAYLPQQNAGVLKTIAVDVEAWRHTLPLSKAMQGEKAFLLQYMRPRLLNKSSNEAFELLHGPESLRTPESEKEVRAIVKASGGTTEGLLKLVDAAAVHYDELARIADLRATEFKPALSAFRQKHARENPLAVSILPALEGVRFASDRTKARFAMLDAAVAVVSSGPAQLKAIKDPFGDGPFEYRRFKGGFELISKLQGKDGTPVNVIVAVKAKH